MSEQISEATNFWRNELAEARRREKDYWKQGKEVLEIYNGECPDKIPFNVLFSNTETLLPALYSNTPRPVVGRRFKDEDPLGAAVAKAGERSLEFFVDTNTDEYATLDDVLTDAVLDALLPGRGVSRLKYEPVLVGDIKKYESVCPESVQWNRVLFGYAKKWERMPWVAFEHHMDEDECKEKFGTKAAGLEYTKGESAGDQDNDDRDDKNLKTGEKKTTCVHEIWWKDKKKVIFFSEQLDDGYLKEEDDPLGLTGFYPMPKPLRFLRKSNDLRATAPYKLYENQAKELNRITVRLNKLLEALKVRGAYDPQIGDLQKILDSDDNTLVPADNAAALQNAQGLDSVIWLMPLDKIITTIQQLLVARQQCKQVIYEVTGISDILRGQSVASETATAQKIKDQWGVLRLKRMQKDVQRYAREMLRITLEIMGKQFSEETFAKITGLPYSTSPMVQQAQMIVQAAQMAGQQPDQQAQQVLQAPQWAQVMQVMQDNMVRAYKIDVETNSTIDVEATEDKQNIAETLQAISQFMQGVGPLVQSGAMPFQAMQAFLLSVVRRLRFGTEAEEHIRQMQAPQPDQGKQQADQMKLQQEQVKAQHEQQLMQMEMELKKEEHRLKLEEMRAKAEYQQLMTRMKMTEANKKMEMMQMQAMMPAKTAAEPKESNNASV